MGLPPLDSSVVPVSQLYFWNKTTHTTAKALNQWSVPVGHGSDVPTQQTGIPGKPEHVSVGTEQGRTKIDPQVGCGSNELMHPDF